MDEKEAGNISEKYAKGIGYIKSDEEYNISVIKTPKKKMKEHEIPILYCKSKDADAEAYFSLLEAKTPHELRIHAEDPAPEPRVGFERYTEINEIKRFIEEWRAEHKKYDRRIKEKWKAMPKGCQD